jgi:hypothetical protein
VIAGSRIFDHNAPGVDLIRPRCFLYEREPFAPPRLTLQSDMLNASALEGNLEY